MSAVGAKESFPAPRLSKDAAAPRYSCIRALALAPLPSPRISQSRRDAIDCSCQGIVQFRRVFARAFPAEQFHLNQAHWVDVRISEPDGSGKHGSVFEELCLVGDFKDYTFGTFEFFSDEAEHTIAQCCVVNEICIK